MNNETPVFPITVHFLEEDDYWILDDVDELGTNLEWFDSSDPSEKATVKDSLGRSVRLKVEKLTVTEFSLAGKA
ncbi:MAG: hypothetical protein L3J89_13635 [Gammaproteobacteria bacterium]|nr:hypothetical protein [Gammaproteobacteria bacterium]